MEGGLSEEVTPHPSSTPSHLLDSLTLRPPTTMCLFNFFYPKDLKKSSYFFRVFENFKNA